MGSAKWNVRINLSSTLSLITGWFCLKARGHLKYILNRGSHKNVLLSDSELARFKIMTYAFETDHFLILFLGNL